MTPLRGCLGRKAYDDAGDAADDDFDNDCDDGDDVDVDDNENDDLDDGGVNAGDVMVMMMMMLLMRMVMMMRTIPAKLLGRGPAEMLGRPRLLHTL